LRSVVCKQELIFHAYTNDIATDGVLSSVLIELNWIW